MKINQIVCFISLVAGSIMIFLVQPWLYRTKISILRISNIDLGIWARNFYLIGAIMVFAASVLSTLIWWLITSRSKAHKAEDVYQLEKVWWGFMTFCLSVIGLAIHFFKGSEDAFLSLSLFFVIDVLLLFWLPTATCSPGSFRFVPPGSYRLRRFLGE